MGSVETIAAVAASVVIVASILFPPEDVESLGDRATFTAFASITALFFYLVGLGVSVWMDRLSQ